ncbi:hypothetical protein [Bacillus thuringiensis]|uniref:hypothetical protein n=1 Tax=Bacillus thuringiensis TaxID=1428 RepID=UPI0011423A86|nr:hypothetical protein [Bacillus thuringiensis]
MSTSTDTVLLTLQPGNSSSEREIFASNSTTLPSVGKGYKELSTEFTVKDGEENSNLFFKFLTDKGVYIDSFKLEKVK